jgi:serine/threonine protein kinase
MSSPAGPGTVLAQRYQLEKILGQGGMGTVYRAHHLRLNKAVAVKALLAQDARFPEHLRQFETEAQILASLSHPGLVSVSDFFEQDGVHYLVMEFVEGKTLAEVARLAPRPISERRVLQWANEILDVLEYLHGQHPPIVVKDLKPENIMLTGEGKLKLIDFGIAKRLSPDGGTMDIAKGVGTEEYAPLEQYGRGSTDQRSDLYSLGATLFFLLTQQPPTSAWKRASEGAVLPDIRQWNPNVSAATVKAVERMCALFAKDRPANVAQARALFQSGGSTYAGQGTHPPTAVQPPDVSRPLAVRLQRSLSLITPGPERLPAPPLAWLHQTTRLGVGGPGVRLVEPSHPHTPVPHSPLNVCALAFSADDRWLALGTDEGLLNLYEAATGQLKLQIAGKGWLRTNRVRELRFLAAGSVLLALVEGQGLNAYTLQFGRRTLAYRPSGSWLSQLGSELLCFDVARSSLVVAGSSDGTVVAWEAATARELWQHRYDDAIRSVAFSPDGVFLATVSSNGLLRFLRSDSGQSVASVPLRDNLLGVAWSSDGKLLGVGTASGSVHLVEFKAGRSSLQLKGNSAVRALAFHARAPWLAVSWADRSVKGYELAW